MWQSAGSTKAYRNTLNVVFNANSDTVMSVINTIFDTATAAEHYGNWIFVIEPFGLYRFDQLVVFVNAFLRRNMPTLGYIIGIFSIAKTSFDVQISKMLKGGVVDARTFKFKILA